jgi:hypothetical protein
MNCPFCGERISAGAVKCPHCSEYIGETLSYDEDMRLRARDKVAGNHVAVTEKREVSMEEAKRPFHALHKIKHFPKHVAAIVERGKKSSYSWLWNIAAVLVLAAVIVGLYFLNKQA